MSCIEDIKNFRSILTENVSLNEAYEDRIRQVAQKIVDMYHGQPVDRETLKNTINQYASKVPLGTLPVNQFIKDVMKEMGTQIKVKRAGGDRTPNEDRLKLLRRAVEMVNRSLENLSDGCEPIDFIIDKHRKYGFSDNQYGFSNQKITDSTDYHMWMNLAARAIMRGDEYNAAACNRYISPASMAAAEKSGAYNKLVDSSMESFAEEHPDLARQFGMIK